MTSTTVPWFTGNCVVVFIVLFHSVLSPVQVGTEDCSDIVKNFSRLCYTFTIILCTFRCLKKFRVTEFVKVFDRLKILNG